MKTNCVSVYEQGEIKLGKLLDPEQHLFQTWWHTAVIPIFRRVRQKDLCKFEASAREFKASLKYKDRSYI